MPDSILMRDITKQSSYWGAGDLPYMSDRSIANYKKMRYHPIISLGLEFTTLGLSDVPVIVECSDEEVQAVTSANLKRFWKRMVRDAFESLTFGFKPFELRYEPGVIRYKVEGKDEEQSYTGTLMKQPRALDPEYVRIKIDEDGSLRGFKQDFASQEVMVKDKKCLIITHRMESGNYYGISAMEPVYSAWYISSINMQFHTRWLERKGTGLFVGRYPVGEDEKGKDNSETMLALLDSIMEGTTIALPGGYDDKGNPIWDIKLLDAADKTDAFIQFHEYLDKTILRGLIIPERALTQGEVGARASVEAFTNLFMQRKQDILDSIVDHISRFMVHPFVEYNWGKDIEVILTAGRIGDDSKANAYKIIEKLVDRGSVDIKTQWLIDKTGIPILEKEMIEPAGGEAPAGEDGSPDYGNKLRSTVGGVRGLLEIRQSVAAGTIDRDSAISMLIEIYGFTPEKAAEIMGAPIAEVKEDPVVQKKAAGKKLPEEVVEKVAMAEDRWAAMTVRERKFELAAVDSWLTARSNKFQADMAREMKLQFDRVQRWLEKNVSGGKPWDVARGISLHSNPVRAIYKDFLNDVFAYTSAHWQKVVEQQASLGEEAAYIGFRVQMSADKLLNDVTSAITHAVAESMERGAGTSEVLEAFREAYAPFLLGGRMQTIAETEIGFTMAKSIDYYIAKNKKQVSRGTVPVEQAIQRVQYSAIMDGRVCPLCEKLNGTIVPVNSPIRTRYSPPMHYMCRCVWMPITAEEINDPRVPNTDVSVDMNTGKPYTLAGLTAALGPDVHHRTFQ